VQVAAAVRAERVGVAEEIRAFGRAVRVAAERIELEAVADRDCPVVAEQHVLGCAVARAVVLLPGEREVFRRLVLEERDLVETRALGRVAVMVFAGEV
jgi:hypothetical protein